MWKYIRKMAGTCVLIVRDFDLFGMQISTNADKEVLVIQMQHVRTMQARILVLVRADTVEVEEHVLVSGENVIICLNIIILKRVFNEIIVKFENVFYFVLDFIQ